MARQQPRPKQVAEATPATQSWGQLCGQARPYLDAGAWQRVFDLLWPHLRDPWKIEKIPAPAFEAVGLLLSAGIRLGRQAYLNPGAAFLRAHIGCEQDEGQAGLTARLMIAHAAAGRGEYREARGWLEKLESAAPGVDAAGLQRTTASPSLVRAALLRGRIEILSGRDEQAESWALTALDRAQQCDSALLLGDGYALLAILARQRGALGEGNALSAQAEQAYWRAGHLTGRLIVKLNRAWSLGLMGLLDDARRLFREVLTGSQNLDRPATGLRAELGLGWLALRAGELPQARRILLAIWRAARKLNLAREEALALEYLTEAAILQGRLAQARTALSLARRFANRAGGGGDLAVELAVREALLALAGGRPVEARRLARSSIKLARRGKHRWEEAQAWRILGTAYAHDKGRREARRSFERARNLYERIGERIELQVVRSWLDYLNPKSAVSVARPTGIETSESNGAHRFWRRHPLLGPERVGEGALGLSEGRGRSAGIGPTPAAAPAPPFRREEDPSVRSAEPRRDEACLGNSAAPRRVDPVWAELGLRTQTSSMYTALHLAEIYAPGSLPVLVLGETGAGKDLVAQGLHALSGNTGEYVPVNCAAAQRELFLAELFGACRGAYTGATETRRGLVDAAAGGTLFLDEVADLDADAQGYLLRFLDCGEVRALGSDRSHRVEARVVTATCRDLHAAVREGRFRRDLFARLAGLVVNLPPLRERGGDVDLLIPVLWERCGGQAEAAIDIFDPGTMGLLKTRAWPGNVRELKQVVERALLFYRKEGPESARAHVRTSVDREDPYGGSILGISGRRATAGEEPVPAVADIGDGDTPRWAKGAWGYWNPEALERALDQARGDIPEAGRLLGLSRSHAYRLYRRLRRERRAS